MSGKLVFVYGTRPEAIKIGPIAALLPSSVFLSTGQHVELLKGTPAESELRNSVSLGMRSNGDVMEWIADAVPRLITALKQVGWVGAVVVQGDTMSAYAGTVAACSLKLPVVHIEAGLRSHNLSEPWPEEHIRRSISLVARWNYAPTERAKQNLLEAGVSSHRIKVLGNPVVSALHRYADPTHVETPENQIVVTLHRREWTDLGTAVVLETIFALYREARHYPEIRFLWPMHPGVAKIAGNNLRHTPKNVEICPPWDYRKMVEQMRHSIGIATDSGGLQEEAAALGVPCAVLRNVTDRPESIEAGLAKLFSPSPEGMRRAIRCLVSRELPRQPSEIYGTKDSANRIAEQLQALVPES